MATGSPQPVAAPPRETAMLTQRANWQPAARQNSSSPRGCRSTGDIMSEHGRHDLGMGG